MSFTPNHELKTHPDPFQSILDGKKKAEFRKDDRNFGPGDTILLNEYAPRAGYTGRSVLVRITHIQQGFGIPDDYVMLSFEIFAEGTAKETCQAYAGGGCYRAAKVEKRLAEHFYTRHEIDAKLKVLHQGLQNRIGDLIERLCTKADADLRFKAFLDNLESHLTGSDTVGVKWIEDLRRRFL